jgi:hypothetical protein
MANERFGRVAAAGCYGPMPAGVKVAGWTHEKMRAMQINRGLVFWGIALVTAGVVALAFQQGYLDRDALASAWRLWPVVLIAIGLSIVLSRTPFAVLGIIAAALVVGAAGGALISVGPGFASCGGPEPTSLATREGAFTGNAASVELDFNCGTLEVALTDGNGWRVASGQSDGEEAQIEATDASVAVSSPDRGFMGGEQRWEIGLGSDLTYALLINVNAATTVLNLADGSFSELSVDPNAGSLTFDLRGTSVASFSLDMNAGSASFRVGEGTDLDGTVGMNAGSIDFCADPGTALRFTVEENLTFSQDLDESELVRSGETWTSANFDTADRRIDLRLEGNAASFSFNPEGGCQ